MPAPPSPPDINIKHQIFLFMDTCLAERIAELKAHYTKQIAAVLAAKTQAEERAVEQEKNDIANERTIAELPQQLKSRGEDFNRARREMEDKERLIGGLQHPLDRVHTTDRELVAQAQEANKMISELRDEHNRNRSPLETARAMNEHNPVEM